MSLDTTRDELTVHLERAFLVSVALPNRPWIGSDPLDELRGLATTAGAVVVGGLGQRRDKINPNSYIGKGKLQELQEQVLAADAGVIIFDNDLSPGQVRNLEKADVLMHALRHLLGRAGPTPMEVDLLHGLARQLRWFADNRS